MSPKRSGPVGGSGKRARRALWLVAVLAVVVGVIPGMAGVAHAASGPIISLTFDDGNASQYTLGYQQALLPHGIHATFFVNSGLVGGSGLTWAQLQTMGASGNEIGGKTVNGVDLTTVDTATATMQVCNDRQALIANGFSNPISFAYPFGARNAAVKAIVAGCGYGSGRTGGSLSSSGPEYSGPNPPDDYYDIRAWAPGSQVTLAQLQSLVNGASANPGQGLWSPVMIQRVCDQVLDPGNYASCKIGAWIELADLNAFLDWVQNAGQVNGAPAGTAIEPVGTVLTASDVTPPVTAISCNGAPCTSSYEGSTVTVTMSATDAGSGVASTRYTLDGSDPTLSSPAYAGSITLNQGPTTVKFRSWDTKGNVEATKTQVIEFVQVQDITPPTTTIACDGGPCGSTNYSGGVTVSLSAVDNTGGSGVDKTYFTLDGSDPTTSSAIYTAPFMLAGNTTVKFFSTDRVGNAEAVTSQQLLITSFPLVVSLTFDDAYQSQWDNLRPLLLSRNMHATFYVPTDDVNNGYSCCMSYEEVRALQAEGNDIGGHTVNHVNLTGLTNNQKIAEVCGGRTDLIDHGINGPVSFAYPFGAYDAATEAVVQSCGFLSARAAGGISSSVTTPSPPWHETIPPGDPFALRAIDVDGAVNTQLSHLQDFVTAAAIHGGGWLPMLFHNVCHEGAADFTQCMNQAGVRDSVLGAFMDWLQLAGQPGGAPAGTTVKTVAEVMVGPDTTPPTTSISCNGSACSSSAYSSAVTVALTATDNAGGSGVATTYYTTDGSAPTTSSPVYSGPFTVSTTTTVSFFSTDRIGNAEAATSQLIQVAIPPVDTTPPTTTISCNGSACSTGGYRITPVTVALSATDNAGGSGVARTYYTTNGSTPTTSSPVYAGPFTLSNTRTVRFFSTDVSGNAEAAKSQLILIDKTNPTTTISCNGSTCSTGWYRTTPVTVALSATDNAGGSGVATTYYTTDGSVPTTSSPLYSGPFTISSTTTVRFFSGDRAGNAEAPKSRLIRIDAAAPIVSITGPLNGSSFTGGTRVTITASASDLGTGSGAPSGLANVVFYLDGTTTLGTDGSSPYRVTWNTSGVSLGQHTLTAVATDRAGNATTSGAITVSIT